MCRSEACTVPAALTVGSRDVSFQHTTTNSLDGVFGTDLRLTTRTACLQVCELPTLTHAKPSWKKLGPCRYSRATFLNTSVSWHQRRELTRRREGEMHAEKSLQACVLADDFTRFYSIKRCVRSKCVSAVRDSGTSRTAT